MIVIIIIVIYCNPILSTINNIKEQLKKINKKNKKSFWPEWVCLQLISSWSSLAQANNTLSLLNHVTIKSNLEWESFGWSSKHAAVRLCRLTRDYNTFNLVVLHIYILAGICLQPLIFFLVVLRIVPVPIETTNR